MYRYLLLVLFLGCSLSAFAGKITGTVSDSKDSLGLQNVVVSIKGANKSVQTDISGRFEFNDVADGTYEVVVTYVSYKKQSRSVKVSGNEPVEVSFMLKSEGNQLGGVSVKATRNTQTEVAVLNEIRKSSLVVSGISAAQISKTMDRNAADVVKRIPGVTIQDDRFINVRGLADRYNTVWLNDAGAPSSEVDKKSFSFDLIPSGLIDRILVFKTPSPELPGDFAGGMVKIYTTSIPTKNQYTFSVQSSYRSGSTGTDFNYNERSSTDWLGYDDGTRGLPSGLPIPIDVNATGNESATKMFHNDWIVNNKKQPLDLRLNGSASNVFNLGKVKIGNTFGFNYSTTSTNYNKQVYEWDDTTKQLHYNDLKSLTKVNIGLMDNLAVVIGNSKIEFKNLYSQTGTSYVTYRTNVPDADLVGRQPNERAYSMGYESKATYVAQLTGAHKNDNDTRKYTWALGYTDLFRNQPSLRQIRYVENSRGVYQSGVPGGAVDIVNGGGRFYSELYEHVYSFNHNFTQKIRVTPKFDFDINLGNYIEYKSRFFNARELGYTLKFDSQNDPTGEQYQNLLSQPINQIFSDPNTNGQYLYRMAEGTADYDKYEATNRLIASYLSLSVPVTDRIKVVGGVRYEDNLYTLNGSLNQRAVSPEVETKFWLPSVNISYNFSTKSLLRVAYGKTINRPEFRETAPNFFYDFDRRAGTYGALYLNDTLKVAEIQNIDARYEWYPSAGEVVQVGGFYKKFKNPIQYILSTGLGGERGFTYINAQSAKVYGVELDARKNLTFLDDKLGTRFLKNFTLTGNITVSKSELLVDTAYKSYTMDVVKKNTLEGQSNYVVNVGVYYQNDSANLQASLLYNVYGPRMYAMGTRFDPTIGELAFHSLDFSISKTFFKHYIVNFGVQNLLDQTIRFVNDTNLDNKFDAKNDKPFNNYKPGRYFSLGVKVKF